MTDTTSAQPKTSSMKNLLRLVTVLRVLLQEYRALDETIRNTRCLTDPVVARIR